MSGFLQRQITCSMTGEIIQCLEKIQVDVENRKWLLAVRLDRARQAIVESRSVQDSVSGSC